MRPGSWLLLSFLLSTPAAARDGSGMPALQRRTLVLPSRSAQVPPLELHVAAGVATLVRCEALPLPLVPVLARDEERIRLGHLDDGSLILVPTTDLAPGERVLLSVSTGAGAEPLRFALVTRRDAVDSQVHVVHARSSDDEDGAESVARSLLDSPNAHARVERPQQVVGVHPKNTRGQVESVLWMGRRLFATVALRSRHKHVSASVLVQARLRATLADGVLLEWPARLVPSTSRRRQFHILTGLLPEGASRLEVALDEADAPGEFRPLPLPERGEPP
jgi:hypothetical protein